MGTRMRAWSAVSRERGMEDEEVKWVVKKERKSVICAGVIGG